MAAEEGIKSNKMLKLGICGEHWHPNIWTFCHNLGLNYVSCSPYRVPIARLAAAQANYNYYCWNNWISISLFKTLIFNLFFLYSL